jgi:hypothetical protein
LREKVGKHPTDRGKLGTKGSIFTHSGGKPVGLAVEGANRYHFKMARETIEYAGGAARADRGHSPREVSGQRP